MNKTLLSLCVLIGKDGKDWLPWTPSLDYYQAWFDMIMDKPWWAFIPTEET